MQEKIGIVLLNLGGPDSLEAVEPFLFNLFSDPEIINFPLSFLFRKRLAKLISSKRHPLIQKQYQKIGGKSPIVDLTNIQARLLEEKLSENRVDAKVYLAMRYWRPFTEEALEQIERDGINRVVLLPLYPHFSKSTTGSSFKEWNRLTAEKPNLQNLKTEKIESYFDFAPYLDAIIERIREGLARFPVAKQADVNILFSAHGTPLKLVREGDPYSHHIRRTVEAVMMRAKFGQKHHLCFQSKVGPQKWLTPSTPAMIEELAAKGVKNMLVVPVAFVSDHLETLFELGIEYRRHAIEKGVEQYEVTTGLNDSEKFAGALTELVLQSLGKNQKTMTAAA